MTIGRDFYTEVQEELERLRRGRQSTFEEEVRKEMDFLSTYRGLAEPMGLDPDPDNPLHKYDYRSWYDAYKTDPEQYKVAPDPEDGQMHWPSQFKAFDHPTRTKWMDGELIDTATGRPADPGLLGQRQRAGVAEPEAAGVGLFDRDNPFQKYLLDPAFRGIAEGEASIGGAMEYTGRKLGSTTLEDAGTSLRTAAQDIKERVPMEKADTLVGEFIQSGVESLPFMGVAMAITAPLSWGIVGTGGALVATRVGYAMSRALLKAPAIAKAAPALAEYTTTALSSMFTNQVLESGSHYADVVKETGDKERAEREAGTVFAANTATALTSLVEADPKLRFLKRLVPKAVVRGGVGAATEGVEEIYQEFVNEVADEEKDIGQVLNEAARDPKKYLMAGALGAVFGGPMAMATGEATPGGRDTDADTNVPITDMTGRSERPAAPPGAKVAPLYGEPLSKPSSLGTAPDVWEKDKVDLKNDAIEHGYTAEDAEAIVALVEDDPSSYEQTRQKVLQHQPEFDAEKYPDRDTIVQETHAAIDRATTPEQVNDALKKLRPYARGNGAPHPAVTYETISDKGKAKIDELQAGAASEEAAAKTATPTAQPAQTQDTGTVTPVDTGTRLTQAQALIKEATTEEAVDRVLLDVSEAVDRGEITPKAGEQVLNTLNRTATARLKQLAEAPADATATAPPAATTPKKPAKLPKRMSLNEVINSFNGFQDAEVDRITDNMASKDDRNTMRKVNGWRGGKSTVEDQLAEAREVPAYRAVLDAEGVTTLQTLVDAIDNNRLSEPHATNLEAEAEDAFANRPETGESPAMPTTDELSQDDVDYLFSTGEDDVPFARKGEANANQPNMPNRMDAPGTVREDERAASEQAQRTVARLTQALNAKEDTALPEGALVVVDPTDEQSQFARDLGHRFGKRVIFVKATTPEADFFNGTLQDDAIVVNVESDLQHVTVAAHELFHHLRRDAPDLYNDAIGALMEDSDAILKYVDYYRRKYGKDLTPDVFLEEFGAEVLGESIQDPVFLQKLNDKNPNIVRRIHARLRQMIQEFKRAYRGEVTAGSLIADLERVQNTMAKIVGDYEGTVAPEGGVEGEGDATMLARKKAPQRAKDTDQKIQALLPDGKLVAKADNLKGNNRVRPVEQITDRLYRETSIYGVLEYFPDTVITDLEQSRSYFSTSLNLAKGQGSNSGVIVEMAPEGLKGSVNTWKPVWKPAYEAGEAEVEVSLTSQQDFNKALRKVIVFPDALTFGKGQSRLLLRKFKQLEGEGWTRTTLEDGTIIMDKDGGAAVTEDATQKNPADSGERQGQGPNSLNEEAGTATPKYTNDDSQNQEPEVRFSLTKRSAGYMKDVIGYMPEETQKFTDAMVEGTEMTSRYRKWLKGRTPGFKSENIETMEEYLAAHPDERTILDKAAQEVDAVIYDANGNLIVTDIERLMRDDGNRAMYQAIRDNKWLSKNYVSDDALKRKRDSEDKATREEIRKTARTYGVDPTGEYDTVIQRIRSARDKRLRTAMFAFYRKEKGTSSIPKEITSSQSIDVLATRLTQALGITQPQFQGFHRSFNQLLIDRMPQDLRETVRKDYYNSVRSAYEEGFAPYRGNFIFVEEQGDPSDTKKVKNAVQKVFKGGEGKTQDIYAQSPLKQAIKTVAALNTNVACPMFVVGNSACWVNACYLTQMGQAPGGLTYYEHSLYTGEILQLADFAVEALNRMGGLRINGLGDMTPNLRAQFSDIIRDASDRGLDLKMITKQEDSFKAIQEAADQGIPTDHIVLQPSMDFLWMPVEVDIDTPGSGAMANIFRKADGEMTREEALDLIDRSPDSVIAGYDEFYGREAKMINGKLHRKYGFSPEQVNDLRQKYPDVQIEPRWVVTTPQEIAEAALQTPGAIYTLMHGVIDDRVISEMPGGEYVNFGDARHQIKNGQAIVGADHGKLEKDASNANKAYARVNEYIKGSGRYTPEQQSQIYDALDKGMCCQENESADACASCAAHCAQHTHLPDNQMLQISNVEAEAKPLGDPDAVGGENIPIEDTVGQEIKLSRKRAAEGQQAEWPQGEGPNGELNVLSLFDGLGGARIAMENLGMPVNYHASEIDKWAKNIHQKNFPSTKQMGAVQDVNADDVPELDLMIGGSPCQDLSRANKGGKGLEGSSSKFFWEYVRLLKEKKPKYFIFENTGSMTMDNKKIIDEALGVEGQMLDSGLISTQSRKRWFWTNIPFTYPTTEEEGIPNVGGLLEDDVDPSNDLSERELAYMDRRVKGGRNHWQFGHHYDANQRKGRTLVANLARGVPYNVVIDKNGRKRKLTPKEVERMAGVPEGYTEGVSNTQRYHMLGNGFSVPVIEQILLGLDQRPKADVETIGGGDVRLSRKASEDTAEFKNFFKDSKVVDAEGNPLVLYHETAKENVSPIKEKGFDLNRVGSRGSDEQVPDGIFLKPTDQNIGVGAVNPDDADQMPLYASIQNPLTVKNRAQLQRFLDVDPEYRELASKVRKIDDEGAKEFDKIWYIKDDEYEGGYEAKEKILEEMLDKVKANMQRAAAAARAKATEIIRAEGHDGVIIKEDEGSFGRVTTTYIALDPTQVKSVDNLGAFDPNVPGTRYARKKAKADTGQPGTIRSILDRIFHPQPPAEAETNIPEAEEAAPVDPAKGKKERSLPKSLAAQGNVPGNNVYYKAITNDETEQKARARLGQDGENVERVQAEIMEKEEISALDTATGLGIMGIRQANHARLIAEAEQATSKRQADKLREQATYEMDQAIQVASTMSERLTRAGQQVQAAAMISRLSPAGVFYYANKRIDVLNEQRSDRQKRKDPEGRRLTEEEIKKFDTLAKEAQEWQDMGIPAIHMQQVVKKLFQGEGLNQTDLDGLKRFATQIREALGEEAYAETAPKKKRGKSAVAIMLEQRLDSMETRAKERLREKGIRLNAGLPLDILADMATVGAAKIGKVGIKYTDWTVAMLADFGEDLRPNLRKVYAASITRFNKEKARNRKMYQQAKAISDLITKIETDPEVATRPDAEALVAAVNELKNMTGDAQIEAAVEINQAITELKRPSWGQRVSTLQAMSHLLNPKTQVRNIGGNEIMQRFERLNKYVATPIDYAVSKFTGQRTVTFKKAGQGGYWEALMKGARAGYKGMPLGSLSTQFDLPSKTFSSQWNPLTYLEGAMGASLRGFDYASYTRAFNQTLGEMAELAATNAGIKGDARQTWMENWVANADENAIEIADAYGKYVTFQDESFMARKASALKKELNVGKDFGWGDLLLKYPKTPANLFNRAMAYSPLGVIRAGYLLAAPSMKANKIDAVHAGQPFDQRAFSLALSRAITGSGIGILAYLLTEAGALTGDDEDDWDLQKFRREQTGERRYQVNASAISRWVQSGFDKKMLKKRNGDTLYTYDWALPLSVSVGIGANVQQGLAKKNPYGATAMKTGRQVVEGMYGAMATFEEQPMLRALSEVFGARDIEGALRNLESELVGLPAQFVPTVVNQIKQTMDNKQRITRAPNLLATAINKVMYRLPFVSEKLPVAYKTMGVDMPKEAYQDGNNSLWNVFMNPGFISKYKVDPIIQAVLAPYEDEQRRRQLPRPPKAVLQYSLDGAKFRFDLEPKDLSELQRRMAGYIQRYYAALNRSGKLRGKTPEEQEKMWMNGTGKGPYKLKGMNDAIREAKEWFHKTRASSYPDYAEMASRRKK